MIYTASDLHEKLLEEKRPGQLFRGQPREYPGPLWPSAYRKFLWADDCLTFQDDSRIRQTGSRFYFRTVVCDPRPFKTETSYKEWFAREQIWLFVIRTMRNALGYPLGEAFFQQSGMRSEGLDVTEDPRIAFFFALHDWNEGEYQPKGDDAPSVIYRWYFEPRAWNLDSLNDYDFYSTPPVVPVKQLLLQFEECESISECLESLRKYQAAIKWSMHEFDLNEIRGRRPYGLIRFPKDSIATCRIARQDAALLLPDCVLAEEFLKRQPVAAWLRERMKGGSYVEDLAQNPTCEQFSFVKRKTERLDWLEELNQEAIFPAPDIVHTVLRGWTRTFIQNPYGVLPISMDSPSGVDWFDLIRECLDDFETKLFI